MFFVRRLSQLELTEGRRVIVSRPTGSASTAATAAAAAAHSKTFVDFFRVHGWLDSRDPGHDAASRPQTPHRLVTD